MRPGTLRRPLPVTTPATSREAPIAAWLHKSHFSDPTVAVTFPGTHKAFSLTRVQVTKLRKALEAAEANLARDVPEHVSIDLMRGLS